MIDVHCHILPGIDDGAATLEDSVALARQCVADGVDTVVCTPHGMSATLQEQIAKRDEAMKLLTEELRKQEIPLRLLPGLEYCIDGHSLECYRQAENFTLGGRKGGALLLEFPFAVDFTLTSNLLFYASQRDVQIILAHPERYHGFLDHTGEMAQWLQRGLMLQFNASNLKHHRFSFNRVPKAIVKLISQAPDQILLGSDAHHPEDRPAGLSVAKETVVSACGEDVWRLITEETPKRIIGL